MKFLNALLMTSVLLASFAVHAQDVPVSEGLPSPYFVDEVHCSGIEIGEIKENWLLTSEEVEPARKVEEADMCERVLRIFGIVKYEWLSPDDLERTATLIRQSGYYQDADLSIKKSELKNHVHIFLQVKPVPRFSQSMSDQFRYYASDGQGSPRLYDALNAEVTNHKYAPVITHTFGLNLVESSATSPVSADPGELATDDAQKFQKNADYRAELYWLMSGALTKHFTYDLALRFGSDNYYSDNQTRFSFIDQGDILATKDVSGMHGKFFAGPAYIFTTYTPYQISSSNNNSSNGVFFMGFLAGYNYGQELGNNLKFKAAYYSSTTSQSIFQLNLSMQRHLNWLDSFLLLGVDERNVQNAVLPEDRFPLSNDFHDDTYIGLSKYFRSGENTQQVSVVIGDEVLSYLNSPPSYQASSDYVGLRYKIIDGTWTVTLAASYFFQRLY